MKRIFTNWKTWAALFVVAVGIIVYIGSVSTVTTPRRDYMTLDEYNAVKVGMSFDDLLNVQEAKPYKDTEAKGNGLFVVSYHGKNEGSEINIILDTKDGKHFVSDKMQMGLLR